MKSVAEISYENKVHIQTLYQRINVRDIPVKIVGGRYMVDEADIPRLLEAGTVGRRRIGRRKGYRADLGVDKGE
jgi:superfamily I DNA/RNA helicase